MKNADIALYQAKAAGRNTFCFFDPTSNRIANLRLEREALLRAALSQDQFRVYLQPIFDAGTGQIVAAEALVRWSHPDGSLLLPADFLHIAEECGLIIPLGHWIISETCRHLKSWRQQGRDTVPVSFNLSLRQLQDDRLIGHLERTLAAEGLPSDCVELELAASYSMSAPSKAAQFLNRVRHLNLKIAIDNFGSGYFNLAELKLLPIHTLKIDRSLVAPLGHTPVDSALVQIILDLARTLNLTVIAEGVETVTQQELLLKMGCSRMQGFLLGEPVPISDFKVAAKNVSNSACDS